MLLIVAVSRESPLLVSSFGSGNGFPRRVISLPPSEGWRKSEALITQEPPSPPGAPARARGGASGGPLELLL